MSQLVALQQKIKATKTTKKITHAIRLVSMSLYARLDKQTKFIEHYTNTVQRATAELACNISGSQRASRWWQQPKQDNNPLLIIVGTAKGLCGSLNSKLLQFIQTTRQEYAQTPSCITIGQKTAGFMKEQPVDMHLISHYRELSSHNFCALADILAEKILAQQQPYTSITVISARMKSFFMQYPTKTVLFPLSAESFDCQTTTTWFDEEILWEPSLTELTDHMAQCHIKATLKYLLFQALKSEQAARFLAMEASASNADKYLTKLTLLYNKLRQAHITKEVSELCSTFSSE